MPSLGLGGKLTNSGLITPGIVTDNLVLKHKYDAGSVIPVSDGAAYFDGANSEIVTPLSASVFDNDFTITAWVKMSENHNSYRTIVGAYDGSNDLIEFYIISNSSGGVPNHISLAMGVTSGTHWNTSNEKVLAEDGWTHVACTFTPGEQKIYKNGASTTFNTGGNRTSAAFDVDANVIIGNMEENSSHDFRGYICNVGIWTSVLTQAQVKSIMNKNYAGLTDSEKTNLVSWWNLDSAYNSSVFDNHHGGGNILGSELIISPWSSSVNWVINGYEATHTPGASNSLVESSSLTIGKTYKFEYTVSGRTAGSVRARAGNGTSGEYISTNTSVTEYLKCSGNDEILFTPSSDFDGTLSNVSVKEVNGNTGTLS